MRGAKVQGSKAAYSATGRVSANEVEAQITVTGEQAVVGPVPASAGKTVGCEQLAADSLIQTIDVDCQACGLNHAAIGPGILFEGQAAAAHQTATHVVEERRIDGEGATA